MTYADYLKTMPGNVLGAHLRIAGTTLDAMRDMELPAMGALVVAMVMVAELCPAAVSAKDLSDAIELLRRWQVLADAGVSTRPAGDA